MITNRRILNYINTEPFHPFRIKMATGESIEIRHPDDRDWTNDGTCLWLDE